MKRSVVDVETYKNFFLVMIKDLSTGKVRHWEQYPGVELDRESLGAALSEGELIGFNSNKYDLPILQIAMSGANCATIKAASDDIIVNGMQPWNLGDKYPMVKLNVNHIDISEPTPGVMISLKTYAGRINAPKMQDLPIEPDATILPPQRSLLRQYCGNDLDVTERLYRQIEDRIELRRQMGEEYGLDLRSKSDAQIAEAVIRHEVEKAKGEQVYKPRLAYGTCYRYKSPGFIKFETPELQAVHVKVKAANYFVSDNGSIDLPPELADLKIAIGSSVYQMGIGGLHSTEKSVSHKSDDEYVLIDADVNSYYPNIISRCGLYPKHMGAEFLDVYRRIIATRLEAKKAMGSFQARIDSLKDELKGLQQ